MGGAGSPARMQVGAREWVAQEVLHACMPRRSMLALTAAAEAEAEAEADMWQQHGNSNMCVWL